MKSLDKAQALLFKLLLAEWKAANNQSYRRIKPCYDRAPRKR